MKKIERWSLIIMSSILLVFIPSCFSRLNSIKESQKIDYATPGDYSLRAIRNLPQGESESFKISKVIRTEGFFDGIEWIFVVEIRHEDTGVIEHSPFRINALDNQVKVTNVDGITSSYVKVTKEILQPGTFNPRLYDFEIQMPPGVDIVEYK